MDSTLKLQIVTPDGIAFSDNVEMVTLPGSEGQLGVLEGKARLLHAEGGEEDEPRHAGRLRLDPPADNRQDFVPGIVPTAENECRFPCKTGCRCQHRRKQKQDAQEAGSRSDYKGVSHAVAYLTGCCKLPVNSIVASDPVMGMADRRHADCSRIPPSVSKKTVPRAVRSPCPALTCQRGSCCI